MIKGSSCKMCNFRCALCLLFFAFSLDTVDLLENGMALTPPMGWMSWGYYMCSVSCETDELCLNETLILSVADTFYTEGYQEAGYEYIIIDDCWSEKQRDENNRLVADRRRFPRGMKFIADYTASTRPIYWSQALLLSMKSSVAACSLDLCTIDGNRLASYYMGLIYLQIHSRGLKFGMYTNIANVTCMLYPGSFSHMEIDAETFAEWGVDYLKVDGCFVSEEVLNVGYKRLGYYLKNTGRPMVFACSWPYYIEFIHHKKADYHQISNYCNVWRNYHDVQGSWNAVVSIFKYYEGRYTDLAPHHGPGHWNDPDMLIFGTGLLNHSQSRVQLAMMVMLSAPILLSCNMKRITPYEKELLLNLDLIAIAQDPLGIMAKPYPGNRATIWVKPHLPRKGDAYPSYTFAAVNLDIKDSKESIKLSNFNLNATDGYTVLNVFTGEFFRNLTYSDTIDVKVPAMDVIVYTLYPL